MGGRSAYPVILAFARIQISVVSESSSRNQFLDSRLHRNDGEGTSASKHTILTRAYCGFPWYHTRR